jgi:hypothetical protein
MHFALRASRSGCLGADEQECKRSACPEQEGQRSWMNVTQLPVVWKDDRRSIVRDTFRTLKGLVELWVPELMGKCKR